MDKQKKIAVIGGSGLTGFPELQVLETLTVTTDWGAPTSPLRCGTLGGTETVFMARHGEQQNLPPHKVNYRANIAALKEQGVAAIYGVNVVGGINLEMYTGSIVIPDQIIDYTWGREHTYSDGNHALLQHVDFTHPYDESLRCRLLQSAIALGLDVHSGAVHGVTQGPRLETRAEIERLEKDGCDIVGMTGMPEAALARELGIPYACLALVVNPGAGKLDGSISPEDIQAVVDERMPDIRKLLLAVCD